MSNKAENALIFDVLAIFHAFREQPASLSIPVRRQRAVEAVAVAVRGRFSNETSAIYSLRDACTRRLGLGAGALDEILSAWYQGNSSTLRRVLESIPGASAHLRAINALLV